MNLQKALPANLGANSRNVAILGGLVLVLGVVWWINRTPSGGPEGSSAPASASPSAAAGTNTAAVTATTPIAVPLAAPQVAPRSTGRNESVSGARGGNIADFKPSLKPPEGVDVTRIDPSLHIDLLEKVRTIAMAEGSHNLFEFGQPPPPPPPKVKPIVPTTPVASAPLAAPTTPGASGAKGLPGEPPKPPPTPIPLKFYGYAGTPRAGPRRAFFLDGDDILVAGENDTLKNRYKIIRIGVNSAVVEDTTSKSQQTLPLIEEI